MAIKETVQAGNTIVHRTSAEVTSFDEVTKQVIQDLVDTMRHADLVGMAAPQIGSNKRIFVTEIRKTKFRTEDTDELRIFVNPQIVKTSEQESEMYEGCGSVASAQFFGPVTRPSEVVVRAQNANGETFTVTASGLLARVIQHEIDHLDGILFPEKISDLKRIMSRNEYLKYKEG